nr:hypothetical protein CFP56_00539 [Quercus suber]
MRTVGADGMSSELGRMACERHVVSTFLQQGKESETSCSLHRHKRRKRRNIPQPVDLTVRGRVGSFSRGGGDVECGTLVPGTQTQGRALTAIHVLRLLEIAVRSDGGVQYVSLQDLP